MHCLAMDFRSRVTKADAAYFSAAYQPRRAQVWQQPKRRTKVRHKCTQLNLGSPNEGLPNLEGSNLIYASVHC